jgi:hypothetical protein
MERITVKVGLDIGGLESSAERGRNAIDSITEAMKRAEQEGRKDDYAKLAHEKDRLNGRNFQFEQDIRNFSGNPHLQSQTSGCSVFKVEAEYAELIESQIAARKKLFPEYEESIRNGDLTKMQKISPQFDTMQVEFHKIIGQVSGLMAGRNLPDAAGIAGGQMANAAMLNDAVRRIDEEIKQTGDKDAGKTGMLYYTKDRMETAAKGVEGSFGSLMKNQQYQRIVEKQASGQELSKSDERFIDELDKLSDSINKLGGTINESIKAGNFEEAFKQMPQLAAREKEFQKLAGEGGAPGGLGGVKESVKAIGAGQIISAINDGFSRWAGSLDRSGIVNQYGSGDIMGGRIAEERRQADLKGGIAQAGLGLAGTVAGAFLPGGPLVWGALGGGAGKALDTMFHIPPDKKATEAAYAGLWQNHSGQAMELAAVMGSANDVRGAFKTAADAAAGFGYSAEEGMDALKEAARQGLGGSEARAVTEQVFDYERRTGADRGTLSSVANMSARYGAGDALRAGWAGLHASGMKPGQSTMNTSAPCSGLWRTA